MSRATKSRKKRKAAVGRGKPACQVSESRRERKQVAGEEAPSAVMRQVGQEVLREDWEPAAWARALVEGNGSRDDTLSHYARIRVGELKEKEKERRMRRKNLELRCTDNFQNLELVPIARPGAEGRRRVLGCVDAVFWHMVAMVAGAGTLMAANVLWPGLGLGMTLEVLVVVVVALQLIPIAAWRAGRGGFTGVTYSQATQMAACVSVLGSVVVGCGVFMTEPRYHGIIAGPEAPGAGRAVVEAETVGDDEVILTEETPELEGEHEPEEAVESEEAVRSGKTVVSARDE